MKKKTFFSILALLAFFCVSCDIVNPDRYIDSLSGVWEGPMDHTGNDVHVKILKIEGAVAELYDMKYTLDGYEVTDRKDASVRMLKTGKDEPVRFLLSFDDKEYDCFRDGDIIGDAENECIFKLTENTMKHYRNGLSIVPGRIPKDKEFTGPSEYNGRILSASVPSLGIEWTDLLAWVGEAAVKSASGMAASAFLEFIFSNDPGSVSLDDVLSRIAEIKDMLNTMITLYHNSVYEGKLNERSKLQYEMHNHNYEAFIRLKNATAGDQAREIIKSWADKTVGGNPAWCRIPTRWTRYISDEYFMWGPNQAENYSSAMKPEELTTIMKYYGGKKNLYEILNDEAGCTLKPEANPSSASGKRAAVCLQSGYFSADWRSVGLDRVAYTSAMFPADIMPVAAGRAIIDGSGIFAQYLEFYKWKEFYDDILWVRTKVVER